MLTAKEIRAAKRGRIYSKAPNAWGKPNQPL